MPGSVFRKSLEPIAANLFMQILIWLPRADQELCFKAKSVLLNFSTFTTFNSNNPGVNQLRGNMVRKCKGITYRWL